MEGLGQYTGSMENAQRMTNQINIQRIVKDIERYLIERNEKLKTGDQVGIEENKFEVRIIIK